MKFFKENAKKFTIFEKNIEKSLNETKQLIRLEKNQTNDLDRRNINLNIKLTSLEKGLNTINDSLLNQRKQNKDKINDLDLKLANLVVGLNETKQLIQLDTIQMKDLNRKNNDLDFKLESLEKNLNESNQLLQFDKNQIIELNKKNTDLGLKLKSVEKGLDESILRESKLNTIKLNELVNKQKGIYE